MSSPEENSALSPFVHLHVHSTYSLLDGACQVPALIKRVKELNMRAIAITDHGNLFAQKFFYDLAYKNGIKPILGCEFYVAEEDHKLKTKRSGNHLILLAKNLTGYHNLVKLSSLAFTEGMYYRPRIDKELLEKYHDGLICSSACLAGEVPRFIERGRMDEAEAAIEWYRSIFGEDYYLEIMLHKSDNEALNHDVYERQLIVNRGILALGEKMKIKVIATNDVHFLEKTDAEAHDLLLCISTGKKFDDPNRMHYTKQEWLKSYDEMVQVFPDNIEQLQNTLEIAEKVEEYKLNSSPIMPIFPIPESFGTEDEWQRKFPEEVLREEFKESFDKLGGYGKVLRIKFESDYLRSLVMEGSKRRWPDGLTEEQSSRIDFELNTITKMGFPGYFLIVHDFIQAARSIGVMVGPGRGSAAGAAVAYCLGITNLDPIKYGLLFERFLNPDRISMPDIDIDFDDTGRQKVLDWVASKYGTDHVSHIATFGAMAPKSCIKDVCRVLDLPIAEGTRLAGLVPGDPKSSKNFKNAYAANPLLLNEKNSPDPTVRRILELSERLQGSVRNTGVHACGIIISRDPLDSVIPVMPTENENLLTTQYDGHFVEPIGLLKMDFLGLKTLTVIKDCLVSIKESRGIDLNIDEIPLDDAKTYELFSNGDTKGLFQFESDGMKSHLRALKPNRFSDLVAMNALYRPGPMQYIPDYIARKHGTQEIKYDHPLMETYLKDTYGITVYQEQVMLQSRGLGNFTRGESDSLRKAMGKKQIDVMSALKQKFLTGCLNNPEFMKPMSGEKEATQLVEKIWGDWERFAEYAFNKSHSVCYAYVAYQTGYLKANYPIEFMCAQISSEIGNFDKMPGLIIEANDMGLDVRGPCVNHSKSSFVPEDHGIRFGLGAIKSVGESAGDAIVAEREKNGPYTGLIDFCSRLSTSVNKRSLEALIRCGAMDCFTDCHRGQLLKNMETALARASQAIKDAESGQGNLFDLAPADESGNSSAYNEQLADAPHLTEKECLQAEHELLGVYTSGHPLKRFRMLVKSFRTYSLADLEKVPDGMDVRVVGLATKISQRLSKASKEPWCIIALDDAEVTTEVLAFPGCYRDYKQEIIPEEPIIVCGRVNKRDGQPKIIASELYQLVKAPSLFAERINLEINLENDATSVEIIEKLCATLKKYPGQFQLSFTLSLPDKIVQYAPDSSFSIDAGADCLAELQELLGTNSIHYETKQTIYINPKNGRKWTPRNE